jgi:hypothetical protein
VFSARPGLLQSLERELRSEALQQGSEGSKDRHSDGLENLKTLDREDREGYFFKTVEVG